MGGASELALWIESAHVAPGGLWLRTWQGDQGFIALLAGGPDQGEWAVPEDVSTDGPPVARLLEGVAEARMPRFLILGVRQQVARVWMRQMEPLIWLGPLELAWQPEDLGGYAVQRTEVPFGDGDSALFVEPGFYQASGLTREGLALSFRRWASTGMDAMQLGHAVAKTGGKLARAQGRDLESAIWALRARPMVTATLWTGPPADPALDRWALEQLLAERGYRIICGGTTAQAAARLLDRPLLWEPSELRQRTQVPPSSRLEGVDLVTEGAVTLGWALRWLQGADTARDLPGRLDAATRLARLLLSADRIRFLVGRAVNPANDDAASVQEPTPQRVSLVLEMVADLRARGKWVTVEWI